MTIAGGSATRTQVRQDIEAALQALASNSKGASAPATIYAGMFWVDEDTPGGGVWTLFMRGSSGWASIGTIDTTTNTFTPANTPSGVPAGTIADFAGSAAPSGWLLCYGQAVSRTTFAALFTAISTTYGAGDGSTTFNLPDLRGRATFGKDNMGGTAANRVTNAGSSIVGTTLGATGGAQNVTLTAAQQASMPVTGALAGTIYLPGESAGSRSFGVGDGVNVDVGGAVSGTAAGGGGAHPNMPPAIVLNKIIKT